MRWKIDGLSVVHFSSSDWGQADMEHLSPDLALLPQVQGYKPVMGLSFDPINLLH